MKMFPFLAATLFFVVFAAQIQAQKKVSTIDDYLDTAGTIVVAKCIGVGPVNILLRADVDVEILHVVKGKETLRIITVASQFRMELGQTYLLKTKYQASPDQPYFKAETRDAVVLVSVSENMALLKNILAAHRCFKNDEYSD